MSEQGIEELNRMIRKVRAVRGLGQQAAPEIAERFAELQAEQIAAGRDPSGNAWPLTQDGRVPLQSARVDVKAIESTIVATLRGNSVRHHLGVARGRIRRRVIPVGQIPGKMVVALRDVLGKRFRSIVGGR